MAAIQMTDRNFSDLEFMEELTDEELLAINGGWSWDNIKNKKKDMTSRELLIWSICAPVMRVSRIPSIRP